MRRADEVLYAAVILLVTCVLCATIAFGGGEDVFLLCDWGNGEYGECSLKITWTGHLVPAGGVSEDCADATWTKGGVTCNPGEYLAHVEDDTFTCCLPAQAEIGLRYDGVVVWRDHGND